MRKIIFRGYNQEVGWVYGSLLTTPCTVEILNYHNDGIPIAVDPSTIGQFTGLIDRNGKEIYEGDVLECPQVPDLPLEVYYNTSKGAFCLAEHTHIGGALKDITPIGTILAGFPGMVVIGNIHDNKIKEE